MAVAFPPTALTNGANVRVQVTAANGQAAFLYTDASGSGEISGAQMIADGTGTFSPAANPVYADPGTYTVSYTDTTGTARTASATVTGAARPSPAAPSGQEQSQISATGPAVTTAQAAGGAAALPATPKGYLPATVNGVAVVIPFY